MCKQGAISKVGLRHRGALPEWATRRSQTGQLVVAKARHRNDASCTARSLGGGRYRNRTCDLFRVKEAR